MTGNIFLMNMSTMLEEELIAKIGKEDHAVIKSFVFFAASSFVDTMKLIKLIESFCAIDAAFIFGVSQHFVRS